MLNKIQSVRKTRFRVADSIVLDSGVTIPCITGQVGQVDVISQNGYRYRTNFWDTVINDSIIQKQIESRDMLGMIEHPEDDDEYLKTPYDKAALAVIKAWVDNHNPYAILGLLNNEHGNKIKALVDVGHHPGVSTRGLGSYDRDSTSQYVSEDNYLLITWDIVVSPNFSDLKMSPVTDSLTSSPLFKELCQMHQLKDSAAADYNASKLIQEMDFAILNLQTLRDKALKLFE